MQASAFVLPSDATIELESSIDRFHRAVARAAVGVSTGRLAAADEAAVLEQFDRLVHDLDAILRREHPVFAVGLGRRAQQALMDVMSCSDNARRWFAKPRGYAGDYHTIDRIYDGVASGSGPLGALLDRCFLRLPAARAVQNRRALVAGEILDTVARRGPRAARVTSLACGPARELADTFARLDDARVLEATLVDFDPGALGHCRAWSENAGVAAQIELVRANLIHVAVGRAELELAPQDLVYSIGLIDYFEDDLVVKLLDWVHGILRPGGRLILGNFHPVNPTRGIMDHVLEWKLIHRDEADMNRLVRESAFARPCTRVVYEDQRINLFAEAVRCG